MNKWIIIGSIVFIGTFLELSQTFHHRMDDVNFPFDDSTSVTDTISPTAEDSVLEEYLTFDSISIPALSDGNFPEVILKRRGYIVSYNPELRLPNWVAWHLTSDHTTGPWPRYRYFLEDLDVEEPRATYYDYSRSGWVRGHMCPAGDCKWDSIAMAQTFLMTNMCPQSANLNNGDWKELEERCRIWAKELGDIYIVCGPILYRKEHEKIGENKVTVPEAFFKVVLCLNNKPKGIGFIYKNQPGDRPMGDYTNSIDQVERITGFDFFPALDDSIENMVEAECDLGEWRK